MRVLSASLITPRTVSIVARLTPTNGIRVNVGRNGSNLDIVVYEWLTGAWRINKGGLAVAPLTDFNVGLTLAGTTANVYIDGVLRLTAEVQTMNRGRGGVQWASQPTGLPILTSFAQNDPEAEANSSLGGITFVGGAVACFNAAGEAVPGMTWANGLPFTPDGRLIVDGFEPIANFVNGLGLTALGALAVNEGFIPQGTPPLSVDPFFTTQLGAVWNERNAQEGVHFTYSEADVWFFDLSVAPDLKQIVPWAKNGQAVTFYTRLRETYLVNVDINLRMEPRSGGSFIGSITIPAGQVFGAAKVTLSGLTVDTNVAFQIGGGPAGVFKRYNFDSSSEVQGVWDIIASAGSIGAITGKVATEYSCGSGSLYSSVANANIILVPVAAFPAVQDCEVSAVLSECVSPNASFGVVARISPTTGVCVERFHTTNTFTLKYADGFSWYGVSGATLPALMGDVAVRLKLVGNQATVFLNGVQYGPFTLLAGAVGAGQVGFRCYNLQAATQIIAADFQVISNGVHIESMSALLLEADGGPAQTVDPYFNAPASWAVAGGATVASNRATFPTTGGPAINTVANIPGATGDTLEFRVFVSELDPNSVLAVESPGGTRLGLLAKGWNAFTAQVGATIRPIYISERGVAARSVASTIDFVFAAKGG
jgi:hypothetical protein